MKEYQDFDLLDGEEILWQGKSEPFGILSGPYRRRLILTWIISAVVLVTFAASYLPYAVRSQSDLVQIIFTSSLVGIVPVSLCFYSIKDVKTIQSKLRYVLTNNRALLLGANELRHIRISENTAYRIEVCDDGTEILYIGDGCRTKAGSSRKHTIMGVRGDDSNYTKITGLVFYGLKNAEEVCKRYAVFAKI